MRRPPPQSPSISLFPFLAVLICTMGVMMLLLVIFNRPGGAAEKIDTAAAEADAEDGANEAGGGDDATAGGATAAGAAAAAAATIAAKQKLDSEVQSAREMLNWKISQLEISRQKTAGDLSDQRLRLGLGGRNHALHGRRVEATPTSRPRHAASGRGQDAR